MTDGAPTDPNSARQAAQAAGSAGIAIAINDVEDYAYALIDDATVTSAGDLTLHAISTPTIYALTVGGSVTPAIGNQGSFAFAGVNVSA